MLGLEEGRPGRCREGHPAGEDGTLPRGSSQLCAPSCCRSGNEGPKILCPLLGSPSLQGGEAS